MQIYFISYGAGDWKSEVGLIKLASRFWQSWIPFRSSKEKSVSLRSIWIIQDDLTILRSADEQP